MSQPLFSTEGSVWRTSPHTVDDEDDEEWVDQSLPSSPLDQTSKSDPCQAGPSLLKSATPHISSHVEENGDVRSELDRQDETAAKRAESAREETPLREINPDNLDDTDHQEPEDERQCRICFSGREEEEALGTLISPCLCTGSVRVSW